MMTEPTTNNTDNYIPLIPALILMGGVTLLLLVLFAGRPSTRPGAELAVLPSPTPLEEPTLPPTPESVAVAVLDPAKVSAGENSYQSICSACHGFNARGIPGLGKTLIDSEFVDSLTDQELVDFIIVGRQVTDPLNTTGVMMPARGGNPSLTDENLMNIVVYIRSLNQAAPAVAVQPTALPPTTVAAQPTSEPTAAEVQATSIPATTIPQELQSFEPVVAAGQSAYAQACVACHAADGSGVSMLAGSLANSTLIQEQAGIALYDFIVQQVTLPNGIPHPAYGGQPNLSDEQVLNIIAYLYTLPVVNSEE